MRLVANPQRKYPIEKQKQNKAKLLCSKDILWPIEATRFPDRKT